MKKKTRKEEREEKKEIRKELKKKQESVLQELAQFMEGVHKTADTENENIEEIEDFAGFVQEESTAAGRVLSDLMYRFTNDLEIGKKIKMGELRKNYDKIELEWRPPEGYNMTHFDLKNFSMKLLSKKGNPNFEKVILQLHGGGYIGAIYNNY